MSPNTAVALTFRLSWIVDLGSNHKQFALGAILAQSANVPKSGFFKPVAGRVWKQKRREFPLAARLFFWGGPSPEAAPSVVERRNKEHQGSQSPGPPKTDRPDQRSLP